MSGASTRIPQALQQEKLLYLLLKLLRLPCSGKCLSGSFCLHEIHGLIPRNCHIGNHIKSQGYKEKKQMSCLEVHGGVLLFASNMIQDLPTLCETRDSVKSLSLNTLLVKNDQIRNVLEK